MTVRSKPWGTSVLRRSAALIRREFSFARQEMIPRSEVKTDVLIATSSSALANVPKTIPLLEFPFLLFYYLWVKLTKLEIWITVSESYSVMKLIYGLRYAMLWQ